MLVTNTSATGWVRKTRSRLGHNGGHDSSLRRIAIAVGRRHLRFTFWKGLLATLLDMTAGERPIHVVCIIPARGGSKGVPGKNMRPVGGIPLIARAVSAALRSTLVDAVFVSTDDAAIAEAARQSGAGTILRPSELAQDTTSSEAALLHGLDHLADRNVHPEVLVFVQCTSPFINPADLDAAVTMVRQGRADTAFSGVATHEFLWRDADPSTAPGAGAMVGQNHDAALRPRRQDRRPHFKETGAFYAMAVAGFRTSRHRFFGCTAVVEVPQLTAIEIDSAHDLVLADALAWVAELPARPAVDVDAVITDFDGVHTEDTAYVDETGRESVRVSRGDGLGVSRLRDSGVPMLIVSKELNPVVTARARKLGVEVLQGVDDKATAVLSWLDSHQVAAARAAYLGNDVNDLEAMRVVGWPVAVHDARPEVQAAARVVLSQPGGKGAVRELCDLVLESTRSKATVDRTAARGRARATGLAEASPAPAGGAALWLG